VKPSKTDSKSSVLVLAEKLVRFQIMGMRHIGTAVMIPSIWCHCLGTHHFGNGTSRPQNKFAPVFWC